VEVPEEEKGIDQEARLASIREQQASLAAQPLMRWLPTVPAEARVEPTEEATSADTAVSLIVSLYILISFFVNFFHSLRKY
jgi:hypothetical protein